MFKHKLAFASLLVLSSCGPSREALMALQDMHILENSQQPGLSYKSLSGSGNDITLNDVELKADPFMAAMMTGPEEGEGVLDGLKPGAQPTPIARAKSMTLNGLTMKDGKPIVRDIRVNGLEPAMPLPDTTLSLGTLGLIGMNEATGAFIAGAFAQDPANAPPAPEAWGFGKAEIGALKVASVIPQEEGQPGSFNMELGELSFADVAGWKLGQAKLAGLKGAMNVPGMPAIEGTFDFGTMTVSGIDAEFVGKSAMAGWQSEMEGGEPVDYAELYANLTSPLDGGIDRIDWSGLTSNFSGLKFDTSELHAKTTRNADGVAIASDLPRFNMKLTADASGGTLGAMGMMVLAMGGYESNVIDLYTGVNATFDPAKDLTRWTDYNVGVTDMFDVKISGGLIGLKQALPSLMNGLMAVAEMAETQIAAEADEEAEPPVAVVPDLDDEGAEDDSAEDDSDDAEEAPPEEGAEDEAEDDMFGGASPEMMMSLMMGILPLQLTDLDISVTDAKLVSLILDRQAIAAGQSLDLYRADIVAMLAASSVFLTDAGVDAAIAGELSAAASGFMSGPGTLRIQIKPKTPLGVMSAVMPSALTKESLGFSATFTPTAPAVN